MRVGILSDVHANLPALEAVLAALDANSRPDAIWVTGDTVGYGPDPSEVLGLLRERGALLIQGNHDLAVATGQGLEWFHERAAIAVQMHSQWLSAEERDHLASLPLTRSTEGFTLCHGSLRDPLWEYVTTTPVAAASLALAPTPHACNGHTHVPAFFVEGDKGLEAHLPAIGTTYSLAPRCVLNPGSVGQPRDGDARAAYAVVDTTAVTVTFQRVTYPVAETQRRIRARALPEMFADRLSLGL